MSREEFLKQIQVIKSIEFLKEWAVEWDRKYLKPRNIQIGISDEIKFGDSL